VVDLAANPVVDRPPRQGGMLPPGSMPGIQMGAGGRPGHSRTLEGAARIKALVPPRPAG
jgi:hypothetical protein